MLGGTALGCQPIHPARWFVDRCIAAGDAVNLAGHFMHEWMHLSGFYHWPDNKARGVVLVTTKTGRSQPAVPS